MKLTSLLRLTILFILAATLTVVNAQDAGDEYTQTIEKADKYFEEGDYINAKASYQYASKLKPDETYPQKRLRESIELIKVQLEKNQQYAQKTTVADELMTRGDYSGAKKLYEQAIEILPEEPYAKEKIKEIDDLIERQLKIEEDYTNSIDEADELFDAGEYEKALDSYKEAAAIKPGEDYPLDKIEETESILATLKANLDEYENSLALAEKFVEREKYDEALVQLNKAVTLKPEEPFPQQRLNEVKELKKNYDAYTAVVEEADELYIKKDFEAAKVKYQEALKIRPDDDYVTNMINRSDLALTEIDDLNRSSYELAIAKADEFFSQEDYDNALKEYQKALTFNPEAEYALKKIDEVNGLVNFRKTQEEAYKQTIAKADQLYKNKSFAEARDEYVKARELKPLEQYPEVRISEIDDILEQIKNKKETYDALIAGADKLFYADDYEEAREQYRTASEMFPDKQYPLDQITMINEILGLRDTYMKELTRADRLYEEDNLEEAILAYRKAAEIDPEQDYPNQKISEIESLMAERAMELDNQYNQLIAEADRQFEAMEYEAAMATYRSAGELKPGEDYPRQRIDLINKNLFEIAQQQEVEQQYTDAMAAGGLGIREKKYLEALAAYELAAELKPDEQEPKDKIAEVNALIEERNREEAINLEYNPLIARADQLFSDQKYAEALEVYKQALEIKPDEEYPRERITVTEGIIAELAVKAKEEKRFNTALNSADSAYAAGNLELALRLYREASEINPEETYPQEMADEIEKTVAAARELEEEYAAAISLGDQFLEGNEYENALEEYQTATALKPEAEYPAARIEEINSILAEIARDQQAREQYEALIEEADKAMSSADYENALEYYRQAAAIIPTEIYPQEKIREINITLDEIAAAEALDMKYNGLISSADSLLNANEYSLALGVYREAASLKPEEQYPAGKITEIEALLAEIAAAEEVRAQYETVIAAADEAFANQEYERSFEQYTTASELQPEESYPVDKIAEVTGILEEIARNAEIQKQYDESIAKADQLFAAREYSDALLEYKAALGLKPNEEYPSKKINEVNSLMNEIARQEELQRQYDEALSKGDGLFASEDFQGALESYIVARDLKPDEALPKGKIEETRKKLDEIAAAEERENNYLEAITSADQFMEQELYESAINNYKKALEYKPGEQYPADKIAEAEKIIAENAEYNEAISFADEHFKRRDWENATLEYKRANAIKPSENYPLEKLDEIESIIIEEERQRKLDADYSNAIAEADELYRTEEYQPALTAYQQALAIKPDETYPVTRIEAIKEKLANLAEERQKAYELAITKGDNFFEQENYSMAKLNYESAIELQPGETYPVDRLKEVNEMILMRRQLLQDEYDKAIADADKFYASKIYDNAIESYRQAAMIMADEAYPVEMIRKILKLISERAIVDVNREPVLIKNNTTEKFVFTPVPVQNRKANYIFFKATNKTENEYKVILSFGEGGAKNGGIVVRIPPGSEENEFIVRISAQYKWFSEDNDWITMYPEGGDLELGLMQISSSD